MKRTFAEKREHFLRRQIFALSQVFLQYFELYCHDEMHVSLKTADKGIKILQQCQSCLPTCQSCLSTCQS